MKIAFTVFGAPKSMKNSRRIVRNRHTGAPMMIKSADSLAYGAEFLAQTPRSAVLGLGSRDMPLRLFVRVFYPSWRNDADASWICDLLQKAGVVSNDRWIRVIEIDARAIDPDNPRVDIELSEI